MAPILFVVGTRPELIKVAPIILELNKRGLRNQYSIVNSAQHKELLDPYWEIFDLKPDFVLDMMSPKSSLSELTSRALMQLQDFIDSLNECPRLLIAQGDTTTVMTSSMVAFYNNIKFIHLEAGLRSFDFGNPFPEEYNRRIAAINCCLHLSPTTTAKQNLINEGYAEDKIKVVGNTVVDSLEYIRQSQGFRNNAYVRELKQEFPEKKLVLITCHRRENYGNGVSNIIDATEELANRHPEYIFIWSLHPNPVIKSAVLNSGLSSCKNLKIVPPLDYNNLLALMDQCEVIVTDSGGIQEEAPSFNVPVIVLREKTERPEGVDTGLAYLVGTDFDKIVNKFEDIIGKGKIKMENPYGDGKAAMRITDLVLELLNSDSVGLNR